MISIVADLARDYYQGIKINSDPGLLAELQKLYFASYSKLNYSRSIQTRCMSPALQPQERADPEKPVLFPFH